ncbi:MAG: FGGY family carbohydrate kinase [Actinomycetota bacterium]|nr:FGGY family carbohydrate kinase [Actinomycetota bacterium]
MHGEDAWLGLDVGTTSSKAVVYTRDGTPVGAGRAVTNWHHGPLGTEIAPFALLDQARSALSQAADTTPDSVRIRAVGVTSMGETGVLVDARGQAVAPAIAWHDTRDFVEVEELAETIGEARFGARTGKPLRGQFSITKHRWLTRHLPSARAAARRYNIAEWIVRGLGAGEVCDRVLACRTGWFDLGSQAWWDEALDWSGTRVAIMPELVDSGTPVGRVREGHPRLIGAIATTAGHDHQAAALGVGATRLGDELDSSGTAEALVRTVPEGLEPTQLLQLARFGVTTDVSIQRGRWSLLAGTQGGLAMRQTLDKWRIEPDGLPELDARALSLNDLQPADDPAATEWRATVESATTQALQLHRAMTDVVGPHNRLIATGGWCNSAMVMDAKHRAFAALSVAAVLEAGTFGAATLAARAAGDIDQESALGAQ